MDRQITELAGKLERCTAEDVAKAINGLMEGGKLFPSSILSEKPIDEYRLALAGHSREALRTVYINLKRGFYAEYNTDFLPIPARMAELVRNEQYKLVNDKARLREKRDAIAFTEQKRAEGAYKDDGVKARIKAMVAEYRRAHEEQKALERGAPPEAPLTPERAAELEKMMALPDAINITAEQQAARRGVSNKIEQFKEQQQ